MEQLRKQLKAAQERAYSLKTKKAQKKAWTIVMGIKRQILDILGAQCDLCGPMSIKGTVRSFRPREDHYLVDTPYGNMWLSPTADELSKSWYSRTCCIEYIVGQTVIIEIKTEVNHDRLFLELIPGRVYGGTVNEAQYTDLCKQGNLAFFKYPTGGMTGLFANKENKNG